MHKKSNTNTAIQLNAYLFTKRGSNVQCSLDAKVVLGEEGFPLQLYTSFILHISRYHTLGSLEEKNDFMKIRTVSVTGDIRSWRGRAVNGSGREASENIVAGERRCLSPATHKHSGAVLDTPRIGSGLSLTVFLEL